MGVVFGELLASLDVADGDAAKLAVVSFFIIDDLAVRLIRVVHNLGSISEINEDVSVLIVHGSGENVSHFAVGSAVGEGLEGFLVPDDVGEVFTVLSRDASDFIADPPDCTGWDVLSREDALAMKPTLLNDALEQDWH